MAAALADLETRLGPDADRLLDRFADEFPGRGPEPEPPTHRLEEMLLTRIANENPAIGAAARARRRPRAGRGHALRDAIAGSRRVFADGPPIDAGRHLAARAHPHAGAPRPDLAGRPAALRPRASWGAILGPGLETSSAASTSPSGSWPRRSARSTCASVAAAGGGGGGRRAAGRGAVVRRAAADEPEAFSSDSAWMPQRRADGQEHVRLARPAVADLRPRHPHARRDPRRGARRRSPAGASPGCG